MIIDSSYVSHLMHPNGAYTVVALLVTDDERGTYQDAFHNLPSPPPGMTQNAARLFLRDRVSERIEEMNLRRGVKDVIDGLPVGTNIPITYTPPAPPAPTAFEVWREKAARLLRIEALALTNATAISERDALRADVTDTYQAGYAAQL